MRNKSLPKKQITDFLNKNASLEPPKQYIVNFNFNTLGKFDSALLVLDNISFGYEKLLFKNINFNLFAKDKITIVGKNGIGKSTLLKLIAKKLPYYDGEIDINGKLGIYDQHIADILPNDITPVKFLTDTNKKLSDFDARKMLGNIGLAGNLHLNMINTLSGGQKVRVVISNIIASNPDILLLDEPTNHLDITLINSLMNAINNFNGAVIMMTHNIDLIQKTNSTVYELTNQQLIKIDFDDYYEDILDEID